MTPLNISNAIYELEATAHSGVKKVFSLSNGERVVVEPCAELQVTMRDTQFIGELEATVRSGAKKLLRLPSGEKVLVERYDALQIAMQDPQFMMSLENAIEDAKEGRTIPVSRDFFSERAAAE